MLQVLFTSVIRWEKTETTTQKDTRYLTKIENAQYNL